VDLERQRAELRAPAPKAVILLDTNALVWFHRGHAALRGWRLATGDGDLLDRLGPGGSFEL